MTNPIKKLLMDESFLQSGENMETESYFSASNTDLYHVSTGQALRSMQGYTNVGNIVLRGGKTSTYTVIGGQSHIVEALADFRFDREFVRWAASVKLPNGHEKFDLGWLESLQGQPFSCELDAMPDGSVAFPGPIGRVKGDRVQAKWIDTILSDFQRRGSSVATKASRLKWVADKGGYDIADNSMRRSNDAGGYLTAEMAVMVGLVGTSNMRAAMVNGFRPIGTMDHWYVMLKMGEFFDLHQEVDARSLSNQRLAQQHAFRSFMQEFPDYGMLLIDTIDVETGLEDAIIVLREFNPKHYALRIDSGDLEREAYWCRERLDAEKLKDITLSVTGGLRAVNLHSLYRKGAPFTSTGIGEYFQFGGERQRKPEDLYEAPVNVEIVTKAGLLISPTGRQYRLIKRSETPAKASRPGILDRFRLTGRDSLGHKTLLGDVEVDLLETGEMTGRLSSELNSLRLDTQKMHTFDVGTELDRPIIPLLRGPDLVNADLQTQAAAAKRYTEQFAMLAEGFKEVDGSHRGCPVGVESDHYMRGYQMAIRSQIVQPVR